MESTDKYIWFISEDEAGKGDLVGFDSGWYFQDETEGLQGPFSTKQEAKDALDFYAKNL